MQVNSYSSTQCSTIISFSTAWSTVLMIGGIIGYVRWKKYTAKLYDSPQSSSSNQTGLVSSHGSTGQTGLVSSHGSTGQAGTLNSQLQGGETTPAENPIEEHYEVIKDRSNEKECVKVAPAAEEGYIEVLAHSKNIYELDDENEVAGGGGSGGSSESLAGQPIDSRT